MTTTATPTARHEFKAEIKQLLDLLIHSVYTSKDIFLRELISNAADALEKVRFQQTAGMTVYGADQPLEIRLSARTEDDRKILVVADTGIGMTEDEVHQNIGTIAHSGATAFIERLAASRQATGGAKPDDAAADSAPAADVSLIGRFGVGFYSVFMAAEKVVLTTRSAQPDARPVTWTSDGSGSYTVEVLDTDLPRGTTIELHLKKDDERFADEHELTATIKRYSNFVSFPILVEGKRVNQTSALWREPASQVKDEQYNEFFKLISHDAEDPLARVHFSADAPLQYSALLYVPTSNPESMGFGRGEVSLQLYVKRVMIDGENKDLLPPCLRFVRGVVESDDLPLNVSRETLQENRLVAKIRDGLTRRVLDELASLAADQPEQYLKFWETFGRIFKEGYNEFSYRAKFQELLRFNSSRHSDSKGMVSLKEYVEAMPVGQQAIYYLSGPSRESLVRDPRLEMFRRRGIEVLYLQDLADEFVLGSLGAYNDKTLTSADQVQPDELKDIGTPTDAEKDTTQSAPEDISLLVARFKQLLGMRVIDVRVSERLVDSPACLVTDDKQMSAHLDKVFRMMNKNTDLPQRVLELNPSHPLIQNLTKLVERDSQDQLVSRACDQIFESSMLVDGYLADPHQLVARMTDILAEAAQLKTAAGTAS